MRYFLVKLFFLISCFVANACYSQSNVIDSLIHLINSTKVDSQKVKLYGDIAWELLPVDITKSQYYVEKELDLAVKIKNDALMAQAESDMGNVLNRKGNFDIAIVHYLKAVELRKKLKQPIKVAGVYNNIATALMRQNKFKEAIDINFKSLKIFEEAHDKNKQAVILGNIGNIYYELEQNSQAYVYFRRGLILSKESGDPNLEANSLVNMGGLKYEANELDSALYYFYQAEKILSKNNLLYSLGATYNNIGKTLATKNDYAKAIKYYKKGLDNRIQFEDEYGVALSNLNIGGLYVKQKGYAKAIYYLQKSELIFIKNHSFINLKDCYFQMANAAELNGELNFAVKYYKLWGEYKDSVYTKESSDQLLEMNAKYETEKKEQQITILNTEKQLQFAELNKQKIVILFFVSGLLLVIVIAVLIFRSLRITRRQKNIIEKQKQLVDEKNIQLNQQNEEISTQRDEIEAQRDLVTEQKEHIEEIHKEVTDSINYAKRIQEAVLPVSDIARSVLGEHFILFKPKDVVSGDFYWTTQVNNWLIVTVADCTGHGVPGAFMSMLGISFLNEIVRKQEINKAHQVLNELRKEIINALQQKGVHGEQKDGMDISLLVLNTETNECQWAGANNPIYIVARKQSTVGSLFSASCLFSTEDWGLFELKGDKMPIAIHPVMRDFTNHEFNLQKGDSIYLFSDGYADQFGGPQGRKFLYKQFKEILIQNFNKPMSEQKEILNTTFENWRGNNEQIDDITILGIKI